MFVKYINRSGAGAGFGYVDHEKKKKQTESGEQGNAIFTHHLGP